MLVVPRSPTAGKPGRWLVIGLFVGAWLAACSSHTPGPPDPTIAASGFPIGSYVKDFVEPQFGPGRIAWTFAPDGRWAEVPLDGAPVGASPVRGTYTVDGDVVTIATDYPPGFGTNSHRWRIEDGLLWTTFQSSDNPEDAGWFTMLDRAPWVPQE